MTELDWAQIVSGPAEQDIRDGAALRELKENLPPDARWVQIVYTSPKGDIGPDAEWEVSVEGPFHCGEIDWMHTGRADTIAEAAAQVTDRLKDLV